MSCSNFSETVKGFVDEGVQSARTELAKKGEAAHDEFQKTYHSYSKTLADSIQKSKLNEFYYSIKGTTSLLDSLIGSMDKLDYQNPENVAVVKDIFITKGWGDSVFISVHKCNGLAKQFARNDMKDSKLNKVFKNYTKENNQQMFALNSPLGVSLLLSNTKIEMLEGATECMNYE
ncbi:MAG: hypothetical protein IPI46_12435 [Bacteroidetes bacterium]|nr:hypothetical protein [Bacteroidota bacterium]